MITFKINSKLYPFPTRWEDVTYDQYMRLLHTTTLTDHIHVFTDIPRETLENSDIKGLEKISIALSFLSISPQFKKTAFVGPYLMPVDCTIESTGQFEALRGLLKNLPKDQLSVESMEQWADSYLGACAIYCQKLRDKKFDLDKAMKMKEELRDYSCAEVIGTGSFFLFKPLNTSPPTMNPFLILLRHLRRWMRAFPGYQRALNFLQRYTGQAAK